MITYMSDIETVISIHFSPDPSFLGVVPGPGPGVGGGRGREEGTRRNVVGVCDDVQRGHTRYMT